MYALGIPLQDQNEKKRKIILVEATATPAYALGVRAFRPVTPRPLFAHPTSVVECHLVRGLCEEGSEGIVLPLEFLRLDALLHRLTLPPAHAPPRHALAVHRVQFLDG